jgi:hypothetical protein
MLGVRKPWALSYPTVATIFIETTDYQVKLGGSVGILGILIGGMPALDSFAVNCWDAAAHEKNAQRHRTTLSR